MKDICVAGHAAIDFIVKVPVIGERSQKHTYASYFSREFGGTAATIAVVARHLGATAGLFSALGDDLYGKLYFRYLKELKIDVSSLKVVSEPTARSVSVTDNAGREQNFFYEGAGRYCPEINPKWLSRFKLLHLTARDIEVNLALALSGYKGIISYDPGYDLYHDPNLRSLYKIVSVAKILSLNEQEANQLLLLLGLKGIEDLIRIGPDIVLVSRGGNGSKVFTAKEKYILPAFAAKKLSPTGAGEALRAGFLTAHLRGKSVKEAHLFGALTASFVLEEPGAQTKIPTWTDVEMRYNEYKEQGKI